MNTELFSLWKKTVDILLVIHLFILLNAVHFFNANGQKNAFGNIGILFLFDNAEWCDMKSK